MQTVLVTGSQGFIGSYLCKHLLDRDYRVVGVDNYSKYGKLVRAHDNHSNFTLHTEDIGCDCGDETPFADIVCKVNPDYIIAVAAMIGGIAYFHKYAYSLLAINERILADTFDAAIDEYLYGKLKRIVVISSSMVFENTSTYPTPEDDILNSPPPSSTYGFQKLACEYFAKGAHEQYGLPYTIVRPFNCVGVGEDDAIPKDRQSRGNETLQLSHVVPDLVKRTLLGEDPLEILGNGSQVRCYTNGADVARGIVLAMEAEQAENEAFNISTAIATTVLELAELIWEKCNPGKEFRFVSVPPFEYDVQKRVPDVTKALRMLGFRAEVSLDASIEEVIGWMRKFVSGAK